MGGRLEEKGIFVEDTRTSKQTVYMSGILEERNILKSLGGKDA